MIYTLGDEVDESVCKLYHLTQLATEILQNVKCSVRSNMPMKDYLQIFFHDLVLW